MSIEPITPLVQEDIQEHYTIYERELNENTELGLPQHILVTNDNLSNRIYFNMYYTFDDRELENKEISIVWINANNERGMSLAVDKTLDGDRLYFAWDVPHQATYKEGTVYFAVRIVAENYVWNSLAGTVEVHKGLVTEEFNNLEEAQLAPGWVDYIEGKYKIAMVKITLEDYNALSTKDENTLYLVTMEDGSIFQYLGDTLVSGGGTSSGGDTSGEGESIPDDIVTIGYSSQVSGSQFYRDFDRVNANYSVYQLNTGDNTLTSLYQNISATDLKSKSFGIGTFYVFCLTPIEFSPDSTIAITWLSAFTRNSGTLNVYPGYVYGEDAAFPNSLTIDDVHNGGSDSIPYTGGGNSAGITITSNMFTGIGDGSQYKESGFVFSGCRVVSTTTTSWTMDRTSTPQATSDILCYPTMKRLLHNDEPFSPILDLGDGLKYNSQGQLCNSIANPVGGIWSNIERTNNVVTVTKPNYTTSTYDVYYNSSGTALTRLHTGLSVSELASLKFTESGNYYIFCSEPIPYDNSYIVSSGFVTKLTVDADGIDVTPCQYIGSTAAYKVTSTSLIRVSSNTQHYSASTTGEYNHNCNCEYFHSSTSGKGYIFTGAKITKTDNCSYFQIDRSTIFTNDVTCYRKAITLTCNAFPTNYEEPKNDNYAQPYLARYSTKEFISFEGTVITFTGPLEYYGLLPNSYTSYASKSIATGTYTYDASSLESGTYYMGYINTQYNMGGYGIVSKGLYNCSDIRIDTYENLVNSADSTDTRYIYGFATDENSAFLITSGYFLTGITLLAKYTWDSETQTITSFERLLNDLSVSTTDFTKLYVDHALKNTKGSSINVQSTPYGELTLNNNTLTISGGIGYTPEDDTTGTSVILNQPVDTTDGNTCTGSHSVVTGYQNECATNYNSLSGHSNKILTYGNGFGANLVTGSGNSLTGYSCVVGGGNNKVDGSYNLVTGTGNQITNSNYNSITAYNNILTNVEESSLSGYNHTIGSSSFTTKGCLISGSTNKINSGAQYSYIGGLDNTISGDGLLQHSVVHGAYNTITCPVGHVSNSLFIGTGLSYTGPASTNTDIPNPVYIFGAYNEESSDKDFIFILGNGSDGTDGLGHSNRSNALTITRSGDMVLSGSVSVTDSNNNQVNLLEKITELQNTISSLQTTITALESRIEALE